MTVVPRMSMLDGDNLDNRIIAFMRLVLAACGLLIIYIDPAEPNRLVGVTYTTLVLYTGYSVVVYTLALRCNPLLGAIMKWGHWIDVAWYTVLISLSSGTSSIFFFGFFFSILVASFSRGFAAGLRVTVAAVVLFTAVGLATAPQGSQFELNRSLVRPVYLLVLGYLMAYWGGFELKLKHRLGLLKEITSFSNPRFGIDRMIGALMERLRAFYNADTCLLITIDPTAREHYLRRADQHVSEGGTRAETVPDPFAATLLAFPAEVAVVYNGKLPFWSLRTRYHAYNIVTGAAIPEGRAQSAAIAATLDAAAFVSVPFTERSGASGRLYLTGQTCHFDTSDSDFLLQAIEHIAPVIDNIRLVDRLATNAAEEERQRIARDLHDSVIQPYIGLQMGLSAVRQKLASGQGSVHHDIERLVALTNEGIAELRGYVSGLRRPGDRDGSLLPALQRFGAKFAEVTGINVQVEASADMRGNDRLAAEVFQMVAESLSNVRRHTHATRAVVCLTRNNGCLMLRIENDASQETVTKAFTPRSITERAAALGGKAHVVQQPGVSTAIVVEIPL